MGQQRRDSTFSVGMMEGDPCPSSTSMKGRWSLVSTAAYLCLNNDPQLQAVLQHQLTLSGCGKGKSVLRTANEVMTSLKLDIVISEAGVERQTGERVLPKHLTRLLAEARLQFWMILCVEKLSKEFSSSKQNRKAGIPPVPMPGS